MPRRVLVVDDSETVRQVLEIVLSMEDDVEVCGVAHNGTAAVMLAGDLQPDVIVMDLEMPGASGIDVLPMVRSAAPAATVLMYSARDDLDAINAAVTSGASAYFVKGVDDIERLVAAVVADETTDTAAVTAIASYVATTTRRAAPAA